MRSSPLLVRKALIPSYEPDEAANGENGDGPDGEIDETMIVVRYSLLLQDR